MKQSLILKKKEEIIKKPEENLREWKPASESLPPGSHWFRVIPYDDGVIPYDKVDTILYYKENAEIKMYVKTFNTPAELTDLGYLYLESPEIILGNQPVFYSSIYPKYEDEPLFFDFYIKNPIFSNMPNHSSIAFYIEHTNPHDLEKRYEELTENPVELKASKQYDVQILTLLSGKKYRKLRKDEIAYSIKITISSPSKEAYLKLKRLLLNNIEFGVTLKEGQKPWSEVVKISSTPTKKLFGNVTYFISTSSTMRNWLHIPDLCPTIPRGTIPTNILSRPNGFRIGIDPDFAEFRLKVEDFFNHCAIVNPNPDLLANLIKNISIHYPVIIFTYDIISNFLLKKGIKCRVYQSIKTNIFDDLSRVSTLLKIVDMLINEELKEDYLDPNLSLSDLQSIIEITNELLGPPSKSTIEVLSDYKVYKIYHNIDKNTFNKIYNTAITMEFLNLLPCDDYTNVPIQEIVQSNVTVFEDRFDYIHLLLKTLTEAIYSKKPIFIVLNHFDSIFDG